MGVTNGKVNNADVYLAINAPAPSIRMAWKMNIGVRSSKIA
jgi:hypothetical protein